MAKKNNNKDGLSKTSIKKQLDTLKNVGDETIIKGKHQHHIIRFPDNEYYYIIDNKISVEELYDKDNLIKCILKDEK